MLSPDTNRPEDGLCLAKGRAAGPARPARGGDLRGGAAARHALRAREVHRPAGPKLARLIYTMLTKGEEYTDQGQDYYEERYRERVLRTLTQRAAKLGMQMVPIAQPA
jgi:hypothetical protein